MRTAVGGTLLVDGLGAGVARQKACALGVAAAIPARDGAPSPAGGTLALASLKPARQAGPAAPATPEPALPEATLAVLPALRCVFVRDLRGALRRRAEAAGALVFFVIVASLFPLGLGPEPALLRAVGPGVVWAAALLAALLSMGRLFEADRQDGTLEQLLLAPAPLPLLVLAKMAAHWLHTGLPLALISPLLALQFGLPGPSAAVLLATLLLGTPLLSLIGGVGAALTVGVRGASVLLAVLVLPLLAPVLVFGAGAMGASEAGLGAGAHCSLLGAMLAAALFLAPLAAAAALRIALE